jgi:TATA-box binding protein (TBP) (component of TFIID and TFIIIB)
MTSLLHDNLYIASQNFSNIPYDVNISAATITCQLPMLINVENIGLYFDNFDSVIVGKKYGTRVINNLVSVKRMKMMKKKKKKIKKNFFNQVSIIVRTCTLMGLKPEEVSLKDSLKTVNIKLFSNGSLQMTGCKHLSNINKSLEILFEKLKEVKVILNESLEYIEKSFVEDIDKLYLKYIRNFCIQMINTNFNMDFQINRTILYDLLVNKTIDDYKKDSDNLIKANINQLDILLKDLNLDVTFDPIIHACVNIKYYLKTNKTKTISIFVFESGSITIAGANSSDEILEVYDFINKFILINYNKLSTKNITSKLIIDFIKKINFNS